MPNGPQGQKRAAAVIGNAIRVAKIATGEVEKEIVDTGKNQAAAELGRRGGTAGARAMSPERRAEIAKTAALKRWSRA